jgi:hypothetical protein
MATPSSASVVSAAPAAPAAPAASAPIEVEIDSIPSVPTPTSVAPTCSPANVASAAASPYATQSDVLLGRLTEYFTKDDCVALDAILPIINGQDEVSLRLVDWFVTNYAKKSVTTYHNNSGRRFVVHAEYKLRLRSYKKRRFDPFCRWERTEIPYRNGASVSTTIGQLNFFKWALENKIIGFIREHRKMIEADMNSRNSTARARPAGASSSAIGNQTRRRRQELTTSPVRSMCRQNVNVTIDFN